MEQTLSQLFSYVSGTKNKNIFGNLSDIIKEFSFHYFETDDFINHKIFLNLRNSEFIIVKYHKEENQINGFCIICFEKVIIILNQQLIKNFKTFFASNSKPIVYILDDSMQIFNNNFSSTNLEQKLIVCNYSIEIEKFSNHLLIQKYYDNSIKQLWNSIRSCISGYLIHQSYSLLRKNQNLTNDSIQEQLQLDDFIYLRLVGSGSYFVINLVYNVKKRCLFALKTPCNSDCQYTKTLIEREISIYKHMNHSFIPKYYGFIEEDKKVHLVIEFINGNNLLNIDFTQFDEKDKINIIFKVMMIFCYLHKNKFIYRDSKPDNIIIDDDKNVFLIDVNSMIINNNELKNKNHTMDFSSLYIAPEILKGEVSDKSDVFSIGQLIYYIINEKIPEYSEEAHFKENSYFLLIYKMCTIDDADKRPSIFELILTFYIFFCSQINLSIAQKNQAIMSINGDINANYYDIIHNINKMICCYSLALDLYDDNGKSNIDDICANNEYIKLDINKIIQIFTIAADENIPNALFNLGYIYHEGKYIKRDINKSIYYLTRAANQNHPEALYGLGFIYYEGKYIAQDINKAIHFYTLAANLHHIKANYNLALLYCEGKDVKRDINKAIHFFTIAADQNDPNAQFNLGVIYNEGKYVPRDINKSIHYYSLAAKQNHIYSQCNLGNIYNEGKYVTPNINKAIKLYTQAANQNYSNAQFNLGIIYHEGRHANRDMKKAIYFYTLAANQNHVRAQYSLGYLYYVGKHVTRDINKAIYFYTLAANLNQPDAQFDLGYMYYEGKYVSRDIYKAIHFLALSANQNNSHSQFYLGVIYYEGKYITRNINQAIRYFTLAANQNHQRAQYNLAIIYYDEKYIERNVDKMMHYFTLAANQNDPKSQYSLGIIYNQGRFVTRNINKAIYYYTLAANQSHVDAQYNLAKIFEEETHDINKAIHYYSLAANQNYVRAQFNLGCIYINGKHVNRDIDKAIYHYAQAATQNYAKAQFSLGFIYYDGNYVPRDINKSIYYYSLAANQNHSDAQFGLGLIYYNEKYIKRDIEKAIYYFSRAADQNHSEAQFYLGLIYYNKKDIKKAFRFLTLAANQNNRNALFLLGNIYEEGKDIAPDFNKSLHYYSLAAKQNHPDALFILGMLYITGFFGHHQDVSKGMNFLIRSTENGNFSANFPIGYFYHEGHLVVKDITAAIHYYKAASSFNNQYAQNNLGIIYKNGIKNEVEPQIGWAIEYFTDPIKKNDKLALYNLAHIYIFVNKTKDDIKESINLLIRSATQNFSPSNDLLCIALVKLYGFNLKTIKSELEKLANLSSKLRVDIYNFISNNYFGNKSNFEEKYQYYEAIDYIYDFLHRPMPSVFLNLKRQDKLENESIKNITNDFYEGLGNDILQLRS